MGYVCGHLSVRSDNIFSNEISVKKSCCGSLMKVWEQGLV